jgi:CRISPR/Cas system-associated exonuclease Cas4 (RecB family)
MLTLTHSSLQTYRTCPRKYLLRYVIRLRREREADALRIGHVFHGALQRANVGESGPAVYDWIDQQYATTPEWADQTDWQVEAQDVRQLVAGHLWRYEADNLQIVAAETQFEFRLPGIKGVRVLGKIDGVVTTPEGRLAVLEYKTAGEDIGDSGDYWLKLRCDPQLSIYMLGARTSGHDVSTALYDVTRKPTIRLKQKETPEEYGARLLSDIGERPDYYYARREIARLDDELTRTVDELQQQVRAVRDSTRYGRWYRNVGPWTCKLCEFKAICLNSQDQNINPDAPPAGFVIGETTHPELNGE